MFDCGSKAQFMDGHKEKFVRLEDSSPRLSVTSDIGRMKKCRFSIEALGLRSDKTSKSFKRGVLKGSEGLRSLGRSLRFGVARAVFPEDLEQSEKKIFDPQDKFLLRMNRFFIILYIFSFAVDPLFLYLPIVDKDSNCFSIHGGLAIATITLRSLIDSLYLVRIALQFRTAYIAPSSRVFGRGELVIDPQQIANRYLKHNFIFDFLSVLPLSQIAIWRYFLTSDVADTKRALGYICFLQIIPRFIRIIPLMKEMRRTDGFFASSPWAGALYYLAWFMLASHACGGFWYLFAIEREDTCWNLACANNSTCKVDFLYCGNGHLDGFDRWQNVSSEVLTAECNVDSNNPQFNFGIFAQAFTSGIVSDKSFTNKFFYCLWWGLQNLSTLGQGLQTTTYYVENVFAIILSILGLIFFSILIGNMQTYLQSMSVRVEEMRVKRRDSEQWMHHRLLPPELRERVRRYDQYKWMETRGVDEESLVQSLPKDLRRDIKRHLCLGLVRRVPLFANMDERLLDAICERLKPSLYTQNTYIIREGDPVDEMLFVIRGRMESVTTDGGRSGFFNRGLLKEGGFCGEELLTWALDPKSSANLPSSTRTVRALCEVETFALRADELKFVASQFRRLHSKQVQHTFRFYSQQWRTWAACFIQAAWRRHTKRKAAEQRRREEGGNSSPDSNSGSSSSLGATLYASRFATNAMRGVQRQRARSGRDLVKMPRKPSEPDFTAYDTY
ncbi:probable cyclic nucleotide-gated ion channel 5 [Dioscorea cayenensis subsp. rotundata]|uniref:Probable cyclic nucleotide-gated ion channel 5 n=1 Tax=Dioscorea cayennensis subsp. rotundata TaxID=55577 RepID=A0AB40CBV9_DIOCR|nr:probable cyclic nucleotide-gated ion channel 5 [Dioscorea cayenensis subsp. rotundata]